jgi:hypothetical protein
VNDIAVASLHAGWAKIGLFACRLTMNAFKISIQNNGYFVCNFILP